MNSVEEIIKLVDAPARECIDNQKTVRIDLDTVEVGQFLPQGDVALIRLGAVPEVADRVNDAGWSGQIVPGTTKGSRHVWDSVDGIEVFELPDANETTGNVYKLTKERTLTHPEHGHHVYPAGFIGKCVYQRAYSQELRRVRD